MNVKAKKSPAPVRAPEPTAEDVVQRVSRNLKHEVEAGLDTLTKVREKMGTVSDALYELGWLESRAISLTKAQLAEEAFEGVAKLMADGKPSVVAWHQVLTHFTAHLTRVLLNNELRGSSTSGFHNATEHSKRAAISQMREYLEGWRDELDEAIARERNEEG